MPSMKLVVSYNYLYPLINTLKSTDYLYKNTLRAAVIFRVSQFFIFV